MPCDTKKYRRDAETFAAEGFRIVYEHDGNVIKEYGSIEELVSDFNEDRVLDTNMGTLRIISDEENRSLRTFLRGGGAEVCPRCGGEIITLIEAGEYDDEYEDVAEESRYGCQDCSYVDYEAESFAANGNDYDWKDKAIVVQANGCPICGGDIIEYLTGRYEEYGNMNPETGEVLEETAYACKDCDWGEVESNDAESFSAEPVFEYTVQMEDIDKNMDEEYWGLFVDSYQGDFKKEVTGIVNKYWKNHEPEHWWAESGKSAHTTGVLRPRTERLRQICSKCGAIGRRDTEHGTKLWWAGGKGLLCGDCSGGGVRYRAEDSSLSLKEVKTNLWYPLMVGFLGGTLSTVAANLISIKWAKKNGHI